MILQKIEESPFFCFLDSALSEALQECHQLIGRTISGRPPIEGFGFGERFLLQFKAGVEINLRCIHALMTKPQCNDGAIDAALQQIHGGAVSQYVW